MYKGLKIIYKICMYIVIFMMIQSFHHPPSVIHFLQIFICDNGGLLFFLLNVVLCHTQNKFSLKSPINKIARLALPVATTLSKICRSHRQKQHYTHYTYISNIIQNVSSRYRISSPQPNNLSTFPSSVRWLVQNTQAAWFTIIIIRFNTRVGNATIQLLLIYLLATNLSQCQSGV